MASGSGGPAQVTLRRAASSTYYALFHALARNCADMFVGVRPSSRSNEAWAETYRALAHGSAKAACEDKILKSKFPSSIVEFAFEFGNLQKKRHDADYNPLATFRRSAVREDIDNAERAIAGLVSASVKDRTAFASWVLFRNPRRSA